MSVLLIRITVTAMPIATTWRLDSAVLADQVLPVTVKHVLTMTNVPTMPTGVYILLSYL